MRGRLFWKLGALIALVAIMALLGWRYWQGPLVEGYEVRASDLVQTVVASGRVEAVSRSEIGPEITAVVIERRVEEGQRVAAGDVLLRLRDDRLQAQMAHAEAALNDLETRVRPQAEVAVARAETQLAQAERELQRQRRLVDTNLTSLESLELAQEAVDLARNTLEAARLDRQALAPTGPETRRLEEQLASARADLARTQIRSESSGIILTRAVEPGDLVRPGDVLLTLARDGDTELRVPIDEKNLGRLAPGQAAFAIADAYPDRPFAARIHHIAPSIDAQRGTVDVRLKVPDPPDFLRQDMTISVTIETGYREQALALPNDALIRRAGRQAEVMVLQRGRVERRTVSIGLEGLARSEIDSGLDAGDRVLLAEGSDFEDGDRVRFRERPWPAAGVRISDRVNNELPIQLD